MKKLLLTILLSTFFVSPVLADSQGYPLAEDIEIEDVGLYYTSVDVENALQEIADGTLLDPRYLKLNGTNSPSANISWGNYGLTDLGFIDLDLTYAGAMQEGRINWDPNAGTVAIGMPGGNVTAQVSQEGLVRVRNESGSDIANGKLVYTTGSSGNRPTIGLCDNTDGDKIFLLGMTTENIDNNSLGYVALWGDVNGDEDQPINTSSYSEGDKLYMNTAGGYTGTHPSTAYHAVVVIGEVERSHITEGRIRILPKYFTIGNNFDGTMRNSIINKSGGTSAAVGFTAINDLNYWMTVGLGGSNNSVFPNNAIFYGPGYNDNLYAVDGAKSHKWYTDPTDSHNNSSLNYLRMELDYSGDLNLFSGNITTTGEIRGGDVVETGNYTSSSNSDHQVTNINYASNGNWTVTYDSFGDVTSVTDGTITKTWTYDAYGDISGRNTTQ